MADKIPLNLIYNELLTQLKIDIANPPADFPAELKTKIEALNLQAAKYNAAPANKVDQMTSVKINKAAAKLWHAIKDWSEKDLPNEVPPTPASTETTPPKNENETPESTETPPANEETPVGEEKETGGEAGEEARPRRFTSRFHR